MRRALTSLCVVVACASCGPTQECRDYVACQRAVDDDVDVEAYDEGGSCWALPSSSRACTANCVQAIEALQETPNAPSVCFPVR